MAWSDCIRVLESDDSRDQHDAIAALANIGSGASESIPHLARLLADEELGGKAAMVLAGFGVASLDYLQRALESGDWTTQRMACRALFEIGPGAASTVPRLLELLRKSHDTAIRHTAAATLGRIGHEAVPGLLMALGDREAGVREAATFALCMLELGPEAIPTLVNSLSDPDEVLRGTIAQLLIAIGPMGTNALAVRASAFSGMIRMGEKATALIPQLKTFYLVGDFCRQRGEYGFSFVAVSRVLRMDEYDVRRHLDAASKLLQEYFRIQGYPEGTPVKVAADREFVEPGSAKLKIIDRGQGKPKSIICNPLGRAALILVADFLDTVSQLPPQLNLVG